VKEILGIKNKISKNYKLKEECPVCFKDDNLHCLLKCGHTVCTDCMLNWFIHNDLDDVSNCIICRQKFNLKSMKLILIEK
jgi:hypothetical protein